MNEVMNEIATQAIKKSIRYNEISRVFVSDKDAQQLMSDAVMNHETVVESDICRTNDGDMDIWGTTVDGQNFRILIRVQP